MTDRPVECSHCKKPIKVVYKEIVGHVTSCTEMCDDCPVFFRKIHGEPLPPVKKEEGAGTGLCCGGCGTTLESVKTGNPLGCAECYSVFSDVITAELSSLGKIPSRMKKEMMAKKTYPLHVGKSPNQPLVIPSSSRLTTLNEALNEALKKENYEQAAWLRDQIKALMEKGPDDGKN